MTRAVLSLAAVCVLFAAATVAEPKGGYGFHPIISPDNQNALMEMQESQQQQEAMMMGGMPYGYPGVMPMYAPEMPPQKVKPAMRGSSEFASGNIFGLDSSALAGIMAPPADMENAFQPPRVHLGHKADAPALDEHAMPPVPTMDMGGLMAQPDTPPLPASLNAQAVASAQQELDNMIAPGGAGEEIPDNTGPFKSDFSESDPMVGGGQGVPVGEQQQQQQQQVGQFEVQDDQQQEQQQEQQQAPAAAAAPEAVQQPAAGPPAGADSGASPASAPADASDATMSEAAPKKKTKVEKKDGDDQAKTPIPDPGSILPAKTPEQGKTGASAAAGGAPSTDKKEGSPKSDAESVASVAAGGAATDATVAKSAAPAAGAPAQGATANMAEPSAEEDPSAAAVPAFANVPSMELDEKAPRSKSERTKEMLESINEISQTLNQLTKKLHIQKDVANFRKEMKAGKQ